MPDSDLISPPKQQLSTKRSLPQILTVAFLSFSLIILLVSGGLQLFFFIKSERESISSFQRMIAETTEQEVDRYVREKLTILQASAALVNPETITADEWYLVLQRILGFERAFHSLSVVDAQGRTLAAAARFVPAKGDDDQRDMTNAHYAATLGDSAWISDVIIAEATSEPLVFLRVPVHDPLKEALATLYAELNFKFLWNLVDQLTVGDTGYAYIVNHDGTLLAIGDTARVLKGESVAQIPVVATFLTGRDTTRQTHSRFYRGVTGSRVVGTIAPLGIAPWLVVVEVPWREAYRNVLRTVVASLVSIALVMILAVGSGILLARKISVPLIDLKETAVRIAAGDKSQSAAVAGPAEVSRLAVAFNSMSAQLLGSLSELELRVKQLQQARDALQESEQRLRLAQEGTTDGIWDCHVESGEAYFSPRWYEILGYDAGAFPATRNQLAALVHPDDRADYELSLQQAIDSQAAFSCEFRMLTGDDQWRWVLLRGKVVETGPAGQALRLAGSITDQTSRKEAEQERADLEAKFLQAQKMESIGRLAGGIAHDFNNMLSVIMGRAELALTRIAPGAPFYADFTDILASGKRSASLTSQLLGFARKQTIRPRVLDMNETIEAMLGLLRRLTGEHIEVVWRPAADLWPVKMDPSQIDQVLANLIVNARDAISQSGRIIIETGNTTIDQAYCDKHPGFISGRYATLSVSDNGCGIDQHTLAQIFEPFFTTKDLGQGTGLGLATVYGIAKQNNGFVNVYSEVGTGSTFRVYVPHAGTAAVAEAPPLSYQELRGGTEKILVVEDEPDLLQVAAAMLESLGYRVVTAAGPQEAIDLVAQQQLDVELLMTDVIMPGMNGRELQWRLTSYLPNLKCLFVSGYTANVISHQGVLEDGVHFLNKPFSLEELAKTIRRVFD